jgi:glucose-1-phosphate cytidylyltransferase
MKVVLFCGGMGMRMREYSENIPKPMVPIGYRPLLWHVMKYYAHFGHKEFILCLGYRADIIKNYFLQYNECLSNDFVLADGGKDLSLLNSDIHDWKITFVDTGLTSNVGQRLAAVQKYLGDDEYFLANYTDGLSDIHLPKVIKKLQQSDCVGCFAAVRPQASFHLVDFNGKGVVKGIHHIRRGGARINGGFFVFRRDIFKYMKPGEELVEEPFRRLIAKDHLITYLHDGYWACMDTFKEKQDLEDLYTRGKAPWTLWTNND